MINKWSREGTVTRKDWEEHDGRRMWWLEVEIKVSVLCMYSQWETNFNRVKWYGDRYVNIKDTKREREREQQPPRMGESGLVFVWPGWPCGRTGVGRSYHSV